jgi:hypothetical protein
MINDILNDPCDNCFCILFLFDTLFLDIIYLIFYIVFRYDKKNRLSKIDCYSILSLLDLAGLIVNLITFFTVSFNGKIREFEGQLIHLENGYLLYIWGFFTFINIVIMTILHILSLLD